MMSARIDAAKSAADKYASMVLHYSRNWEVTGTWKIVGNRGHG